MSNHPHNPGADLTAEPVRQGRAWTESALNLIEPGHLPRPMEPAMSEVSEDEMEAVARAIYDHANTQHEEPWVHVSPEMRDWFHGHARAAIRALDARRGR